MPISKKAKVQRDHKKAEAAGTRVPVKANGLPVKPPKPTSICVNCRKEIINTNLKQLEVHAATHDAKLWPKEKCWPNDFKEGDVVVAGLGKGERQTPDINNINNKSGNGKK